MPNLRRIAESCVLLGFLMAAAPGCQREPHEGFYDRDHHRWYHEHSWRDCNDREEHCR